MVKEILKESDVSPKIALREIYVSLKTGEF